MNHKESDLTIHLIRHGQSEMNTTSHLICGRSEGTPLTQAGRDQATKLGHRFKEKGVHFEAIYTSPLIRAKETCELVVAQINYPKEKIIEVPQLVEFSQGDWEGKPRVEIYTTETLRYQNTKGEFFTPPNGESEKMVELRAANWFMEEIINNPQFSNTKAVIGIFSHGLTIKCLLHWVIGFSDRYIYKMSVDNTSVSTLKLGKEGWWIEKINDTAHLG